MLEMLKINGDLNSRGVSNGSFQRDHDDKMDCTLPLPDFCALKCTASVSAKEERDTEVVGLPGVFLQEEASEDDEPLPIKLTGASNLLSVECDEIKWRKHLRSENGKWITHSKCNKITRRTLSASLMACNKLAKSLKE